MIWSWLSGVMAVGLMILVVSGGEIRCRQCDGYDCLTGADCLGDFCFAAEFRPVIGGFAPHSNVKSDWFEKGCGWGRIPPEALDTCEYSGRDPAGQVVRSCLCGEEFCNSDVKKLKVVQPQLYDCRCDDFSYCRKGRCRGDLCTYVVGPSGTEDSRGCLNTSAPLLERHLRDVCVTPGFAGGRHHTAKDLSVALDYEMCSCAGQLCNDVKPPMAPVTPEDTVECRMDLKAYVKDLGSFQTPPNRTCRGRRCFSAEFNTESIDGSATGCIRWGPKAKLPPDGCVRTQAGRTTTEFCLGRQLRGGKIVVESTTPTPTTSQPDEISSPGQEATADEGKFAPTPHSPAPTRAKLSAAGEKAAEDDRDIQANNTAIIVVFLLLIVAILAVGIAWKFDLHKKIFAARYQTVSG